MANALPFSKRIAYWSEYAALRVFFFISKLLPYESASAMGSFCARLAGPYLKWHRIAQFNLQRAYPNYTAEQINQTLINMWDNLGRTLAETPWLGSDTMRQKITISDAIRGVLEQYTHSDRPIIFVSAHLANWEIVPWLGALTNIPITSIYRKINNPYVDALYFSIRQHYCNELAPKGQKGARALYKAMRRKDNVGMLVDQKQNDSAHIKFFGLPAATTSTAAELALKYDAIIIALHVERLANGAFKIHAQEVQYTSSQSPKHIMQTINDVIETWVRKHPEQWLWVHQRWGKISAL